MSSSLTRAAEVQPPSEGNVLVISVTGTSAATDISSLQGSWVTFAAEDEAIYYVVGDSTVEADPAATTGDTRCGILPAGQSTSWFYGKEKAYTHIALECTSAATARLWQS
ncbi:MAG: hypothetical protein GWN58_58475 [Anaerolineae bacterium]|nr:hypothetical protein [Anaerolineae bacterium]